MTDPIDDRAFRDAGLGRTGGGPDRSARSRGVFPRIEAEGRRCQDARAWKRRSRPSRRSCWARSDEAPTAAAAAAEDPHRRLRQGRSARGAGALRRARQGLRQAAAHEGGHRRTASRAPSWRASPRPTRRSRLLGRKVVIVANLQPRKLRGIESNGMIVAASVEGGKPVLAGFLEDIPVGSAAEVKLVDSHCHLDDPQFDEDREQVIERAPAAGVERMMAIGTGNGPPDLEAAVRLADRYPFRLRHGRRASARRVEGRRRRHSPSCGSWPAHPKVLAVGEIGLDYHYDFSPRDVQRAVFVAAVGTGGGGGQADRDPHARGVGRYARNPA